jgi:hypothetical protein
MSSKASAPHVMPVVNETDNNGISLVCLEASISPKQIPKSIAESAAKFDGIRVQNYIGETGTLRWVGELGKESQWGKGIHGAVQYDTPSENNPHRTDGVFIPFKVALAERRAAKMLAASAASAAAIAAIQEADDDETEEVAKEGEVVDNTPASTAQVRYATCPPSTCGFTPLRHLYYEVIPSALKKLRHHFTEVQPTPYVANEMHDVMLIKFLIARQFNWEKVLIMLSNHAEWRKTVPPYDPNCVFDPAMAEGFPIGDSEGTDMEGNLLHYSRPGCGGAISPGDFVKKFGEETCHEWHLQEVLGMQEKLKSQNFVAKRYTFIYDLKDIGAVDSTSINWGRAIGQLDQDHNPEMLSRVFIINTPLLFRGAFSIFALIMDERTKDKIKVLGSDYHKELAKYIDSEYLPDFAGGTNRSWMSNGGIVGKRVTPEEWAIISKERKEKQKVSNEDATKAGGATSSSTTPATTSA